jgi:regulator of RNase E activity RraA
MDLVARLARLGTSGLADVMDEAGLPGQVLSPVFRPLDPKAVLVGRALCCRGERAVKTAQKLPPRAISGFAVERRMQPGLVAVIDVGGDCAGAMLGGLVAQTLKAAGCGGLVVHGAVRDRLEIEAVGLPAYCLALSPANGAKRRELVEIDRPVRLPGVDGLVTVAPGDYLLGDADGVVVVPARHAAQIVEAAETLEAIEAVIRDEIAAGASREEALGRHARFAHVAAVARDGDA